MQHTPAIILAGGFGTRLQSVVKDLPKPMADINQKPFLHYIFQYLQKNNIKKVVLSVGYLHHKISSYFGNNYLGIDIGYSIENEPLGTGGAIKKAFDCIQNDAFVLNGDTFFDIDLKSLKNVGNDIQIALKPMCNFNRYGTVIIDENNIITAFNEKKSCEEGLINGGVYYLKHDIFKNLKLPEEFSFEKDILENREIALKIGANIYDNYFIDIGIPEDYYKTKEYLQ